MHDPYAFPTMYGPEPVVTYTDREALVFMTASLIVTVVVSVPAAATMVGLWFANGVYLSWADLSRPTQPARRRRPPSEDSWHRHRLLALAYVAKFVAALFRLLHSSIATAPPHPDGPTLPLLPRPGAVLETAVASLAVLVVLLAAAVPVGWWGRVFTIRVKARGGKLFVGCHVIHHLDGVDTAGTIVGVTDDDPEDAPRYTIQPDPGRTPRGSFAAYRPAFELVSKRVSDSRPVLQGSA